MVTLPSIEVLSDFLRLPLPTLTMSLPSFPKRAEMSSGCCQSNCATPREYEFGRHHKDASFRILAKVGRSWNLAGDESETDSVNLLPSKC